MTTDNKRNRDSPTKAGKMPQPSPNPKDKKINKKTPEEEETDPKDQEEADLTPRSLVAQFDKQAKVNEDSDDKTATVFEWHRDGRQPPTKAFQATPQTFIDRATPFSENQVYPQEDNEDTIHDLIRTARSLMEGSSNPLYEPTKEEFLELLTQANNSKHAIGRSKAGKTFVKTSLRLARSSPEIFRDCYDNKTGKLKERRDTKAWAAANLFYGSHWTFEVKPLPKPAIASGKKKKTPLQQTSIRFQTKTKEKNQQEANPWKLVQTNRGLFRKKTTMPSTGKSKEPGHDHQRKYKTYLKARLPAPTAVASADAEAVKAFNDLRDSLLKFDQKTVVYAWKKPWEKSNSTSHPTLTKSSSAPESKATVEAYVDRLYVAVSKSPFVRFVIGHDQKIEALDNWDHPTLADLRAKNIQLNVETIQDADIATAGWFMGSHPKSFNCKSFGPVLQAHSKLQPFQIELQTRTIKPDLKHQWKSSDPRAVHVFCARQHLDGVKKALNSIYGSKGKLANMPMGRSLRFIPFTADPRGRAPLPAVKRNIMAAVRKQKRFIESTEVLELHGVVDLDYAQNVPGHKELCIREILQSMKASDCQTNMFLAVDERWNGQVSLTVHKSLDDQAQLIVSYLPLLLAEKFGPRAWGWFTGETLAELSGYYWDAGNNCIASTDKETVAANLAGFDEYDDFSDASIESVESNGLEINIELQIDMDDPPDDARIVGDENRSVTTFRGLLGKSDTSVASNSPETQDTTKETQHDPQHTDTTPNTMDTDRNEDLSTITDDQTPSSTTATTNSTTRDQSNSHHEAPSTGNALSGQDE